MLIWSKYEGTAKATLSSSALCNATATHLNIYMLNAYANIIILSNAHVTTASQIPLKYDQHSASVTMPETSFTTQRVFQFAGSIWGIVSIPYLCQCSCCEWSRIITLPAGPLYSQPLKLTLLLAATCQLTSLPCYVYWTHLHNMISYIITRY